MNSDYYAVVDARLVLEDGTVFTGRSVGAAGVAAGEACFTTASAGYEQAVTDPSYARQVLTFASPLVGNYGVDERGCEREHLARVARVGDGLLVSRRGGREAGLPGGDPGRADRVSCEDGAVLEYEPGVH